ncbi:hypothetical protein GC169_13245 [bacterium]|nr:hypothetical protein [bacterium]
MSIALDVKVDEQIIIGEDESCWTVVEVAPRARAARLLGPGGRVCSVTSDSDVEIAPDIYVRLDLGFFGHRLMFRAAPHVPIHRSDVHEWIEARRGDI